MVCGRGCTAAPIPHHSNGASLENSVAGARLGDALLFWLYFSLQVINNTGFVVRFMFDGSIEMTGICATLLQLLAYN